MTKINEFKPIHVLLADDDADDRYFFQEALKEFAFEVRLTTVHDGEQLMKQLNMEAGKLPDVLFLDLNMPRKNGFECFAEIKGNALLNHLPVIIYSTSYHTKIADLLYKNGASYYISKPSEISRLKKVVQEIITHIAQGNTTPPAQGDFTVTMEKKNYQKISWFDNLFSKSLPEKTQ